MQKFDENERFKHYLESCASEKVDHLVHGLNDEITPKIDCLSCGNCCRSLMINIEEGELQPIAQHLGTSESNLKAEHVETSQQGLMVMNAIPCAFLNGNSCTVYEHRFTDCRAFPHLHRPHFTDRLFGTFMHYGRCLIIYNVVEELKNQVGFKRVVPV